MSFTEDELQSFNNILEQRLSAQSQAMEQAFDQRMSALRHDMEEHFAAIQQDNLRTLSLRIADALSTALSQNLSTQQTQIISAFNHDVEQRQQHIEGTIDSMLAAQLLGIEQLLDQRLTHPKLDDMPMSTNEVLPQLDTIEVQTDLTWEDLSDVIGKALDQRLSVLHESTHSAIRNLEQDLSARLYSLREELLNGYIHVQASPQSFDEMPTSMQEVLRGIDHLERIIESLQVAMTSNSALLSNRLYHHQQLPLERAHPASRPHTTPSNGVTAPLPIVRERHENVGQIDLPDSEGKSKTDNSN